MNQPSLSKWSHRTWPHQETNKKAYPRVLKLDLQWPQKILGVEASSSQVQPPEVLHGWQASGLLNGW